MDDLDTVTAASGVLIDPEGPDGFAHLATAWSVGPGEWLTVWTAEQPPALSVRLLLAGSALVGPVMAWEQDDDNPIAAFTSTVQAPSLALAPEGSLRKREALAAIGFASVIEHPFFNLQRAALDPVLYHPYLCPWRLAGHCALFALDDGYVPGACPVGMAGAPVLSARGVVGIVVEGAGGGGTPALTRFRRLA